ncbi:unnamed protein product [Candidula unifasciata]|uniref:Uncharacterized protein n=1 Tax=Candidula unifasciata TaxID=100452 RepID=A0A8S3ZT17_9EUPU|nr:unnamed protein product [Candidula unifasciata]
MRMTQGLVYLLCCVVLAAHTAAQNTNACYSNETNCLSEFRQLLRDTDRFWFGSSFERNCPPSLQNSMECSNPNTTQKSILSRLLGLNDTDPTVMEIAHNISLANITYTVPAGNYTACGQDYDVPALNGHLVDPLIVTRASLWSLSFRPGVTWTPKTQDNLAILVIWDPGNFFNHGLYINCVNGSIDTGEVVTPYLGPLNPLLRVNTYIFAVYEQTNRIDINAARRFIPSRGSWQPATFIANFTSPNNSYPTHAGVLTILADPYSIQKIYDRFYLANNCPRLVSQLDAFHTVIRVSNLTVPWSDNTTTTSLYNNGTYLTSLTTNIEVRYSADDFSVESCCSNYSLTRGSTLVNPFSSRTLRPGNVRVKPVVQLTPMKIGTSEGIAGDTYTLFLVDVAAALAPGALNPVYVTHWLVTNIRNADVVRGDEVAPYFGPNPFSPNESRPYMFLLFRQPVPMLNNTVFSTFCPNGTLRCRTQLKPVLDAWNLTELVGVTWFLAEQDAFARYRLYSLLNVAKDTACKGVPGYADPCPQTCPGKSNNGASHRTGYFFTVFLFFGLVIYYYILI